MLASINGNRIANFMHGFLLHEGKNVERDIEGAIHYYKEASSFNISYAKNNLGIIYKHGINNQIEKRLGNSIIYFEEAISQKNDYLSMYNLAHILFYDETIKKDINKLIDLLIKSSDYFYHSNILLSIVLIQHIGKDIDKIKREIDQRTNNNNKISTKIIKIIRELKLFDEIKFFEIYSSYRNIDFLYDADFHPILSTKLEQEYKKEINPKYSKAQKISFLFYEGFGFNI
ncbi:hypothetical protein M9Y10_015399 [Tritrichomonas musculus]|uniref:Sel1 repeat family protein n=1 Tax=Tritrichomonas musculus TaxID=1915356 RepID=A0ABR2L264_9EUKA